jgi:hypothetical protein
LIQWFNANISAHNIKSYLYVTYLLDCQKIVLHSSQPAGVKARAFGETMRWAAHHRGQILRDGRRVGGMLLNRLKQSTAKR